MGGRLRRRPCGGGGRPRLAGGGIALSGRLRRGHGFVASHPPALGPAVLGREPGGGGTRGLPHRRPGGPGFGPGGDRRPGLRRLLGPGSGSDGGPGRRRHGHRTVAGPGAGRSALCRGGAHLAREDPARPGRGGGPGGPGRRTTRRRRMESRFAPVCDLGIGCGYPRRSGRGCWGRGPGSAGSGGPGSGWQPGGVGPGGRGLPSGGRRCWRAGQGLQPGA